MLGKLAIIKSVRRRVESSRGGYLPPQLKVPGRSGLGLGLPSSQRPMRSSTVCAVLLSKIIHVVAKCTVAQRACDAPGLPIGRQQIGVIPAAKFPHHHHRAEKQARAKHNNKKRRCDYRVPKRDTRLVRSTQLTLGPGSLQFPAVVC